MLEWIGADYNTLHEDLKVVNNSSWQQFVLAGLTGWGPDVGGAYFIVYDTVTSNPMITMGSRTRFLRQYFQYVRRGAQRINAVSSNSNFDALAFVNVGGNYTVVVKALTGGSFNVQGLPNLRWFLYDRRAIRRITCRHPHCRTVSFDRYSGGGRDYGLSEIGDQPVFFGR